MAQTDTLVQRVRSGGVRGASTVDLVAIGFTRRESDANSGEAMARNLLSHFQGIRALGDVSLADCYEFTGLEEFEALQRQALIELGRRVGGAGKGPITRITCGEDAIELLEHLKHEKREHFVAILLDSQQGILRVVPVHIGTLTMSIVGPREVFREAIRESACSIIVAHNHPSGDPTPSDEDIEATKLLAQIGEMLEIPLQDHIIIGENYSISLREDGYMG